MTTFENIIDLIRINDLKYWTIRTKKDANSYVFKFDKEKDVNENIERMKSVMSLYYGDYFIFEGKENPDSNKGAWAFEFSNKNVNSNVAQAASPVMVSGISEDEMERKLALKAEEIEQKYRQRDLDKREKEIKERERDFEKNQNNAWSIIAQNIGRVIPKLFPQVGVAGLEDETSSVETYKPEPTAEEIENADEQSKKAEDLICRFAEVEPDWLLLLEKMVVLAESKDAMYTMAKNYLLK